MNNKFTKGIILAGGTGSRLGIVTKIINKHLLPVYDKPLIFFPLTLLAELKLTNVLIICNKEDIDSFKKLIGNNFKGIIIEYAIQDKPRGIADAFKIGRTFIGTDNVVLALGDNVFITRYPERPTHYTAFLDYIFYMMEYNEGVTVVIDDGVSNLSDYGVLNFDIEKIIPISIEEKPSVPLVGAKAITGLYFYDNKVINIAKNIKSSKRGELEISDINKEYLKQNELNYLILPHTINWLDVGSPEAFLKASKLVAKL